MAIEIKINDSQDAKSRYITYAPSPCQIRQTPAATALTVTLSSRAASAGGGEAVFYASRTVGATPTATLSVTLPANGSWVDFGLGGRPGKPSTTGRPTPRLANACDVRRCEWCASARTRTSSKRVSATGFCWRWQAQRRTGPNAKRLPDIAQHARIRRERPGTRGPQFLPWHRTYLLDLERQLQAIDPSVSIHYWRSDEPAPNVFSQAVHGRNEAFGRVGRLGGPRSGEPAGRGSPTPCPAFFVRRSSTLTQAAPANQV